MLVESYCSFPQSTYWIRVFNVKTNISVAELYHQLVGIHAQNILS